MTPSSRLTRRGLLPMLAASGWAGASLGRACAETRKPLLVFAAASLQPALTAVSAEWRQAGGAELVFSFASSAALARQIEQGAPADVFASADLEWMEWLRARALVRADSITPLLGNRLVLIAAAGERLTLDPVPGFALAEALAGSRLALGDPASVPAGRYAMAALKSLNVWEGVQSRLAPVENVRVALALVARGEARLGIVYATDAASEPKVRVVAALPETSHPPILYPFAVTAGSTHAQAARFLAFLRSEAAARIFAAQGFSLR